MGDVNGSFCTYHLIESGIKLKFCQRIQSGGGFVQHHEGRILIQRSCQRKLLGFPTGQLHPAGVKVLIQIGVKPLWQLGKPLAKARFL